MSRTVTSGRILQTPITVLHYWIVMMPIIGKIPSSSSAMKYCHCLKKMSWNVYVQISAIWEAGDGMSRKGLKIKGDNCFPPITTLRFCQILKYGPFHKICKINWRKDPFWKKSMVHMWEVFFFLWKSIVVCNANWWVFSTTQQPSVKLCGRAFKFMALFEWAC